MSLTLLPGPKSSPATYDDDRWRDQRLVYAVVDPDGQLTFVRAGNSTADWLDGLHNALGRFIDLVCLKHQLEAYVNGESVHLLGLPPNPVGTAMCGLLTDRHFQPLLVGSIVFVGEDNWETVSLTGGQRHLIIDAWSEAIAAGGTDATDGESGDGRSR